MKHKPHAWIRNIVRLIVLAPFEVLIIFSASWTLGFSTTNTKTCRWTHSSAKSISLFHHDRMLKCSTSVFSQLSFFQVVTPQNNFALKCCVHFIPHPGYIFILSSDELSVQVYKLLNLCNIFPTFCCNLYFLCWFLTNVPVLRQDFLAWWINSWSQ